MLYSVALVLALCQAPSPEAAKYLGDALGLIQKDSRMKGTDWAAMRKAAFEEAKGARTPADTYPAIRAALQSLNDHHSRFFDPPTIKLMSQGRAARTGLMVVGDSAVRATPGSPAAKARIPAGTRFQTLNGAPFSEEGFYAADRKADPLVLTGTPPGGRSRTWTLQPAEFVSYNAPSGRLVRGRYGYLALPGLQGTEAMNVRYATALQDAIRKADRKGLKGWIVDLRLDTGGNCWPMLAGLGPLLPPGSLGSFSDGSGDWTYRDGKSFGGTQELAHAERPYVVRNAALPIVVLQGSFTASSGEIALIAFKGMPNATFVGEPSEGVPTANLFLPLADGAAMTVCVAVDVDRTGKAYDAAIPPDVTVANDWSRWGRDDDPGVQAAIRLIETRRSP